MILRLLNIPVTIEFQAGHALPHFLSPNRYLSHGDDPYSALAKTVPEHPATAMGRMSALSQSRSLDGCTEAFWRLWACKEPIDFSPLPEPLRDLFVRSQLILRHRTGSPLRRPGIPGTDPDARRVSASLAVDPAQVPGSARCGRGAIRLRRGSYDKWGIEAGTARI